MIGPVDRLRADVLFPPSPIQREEVEVQRARMAENIQDTTADRFKGDDADSDASKNRHSREEIALKIRSLSERADDIQRARAQISLARGDLREVSQVAARTLAAEDTQGATIALDRVAEASDTIRQAVSLLGFAAAGVGLRVTLEAVQGNTEDGDETSEPTFITNTPREANVSTADKAAERAAAALTRALRGDTGEKRQSVPEPTPADTSAGVGEDYFPYGLPVQAGGGALPETEAKLQEVVTSVLREANVGVRHGRSLVSSLEDISLEDHAQRAFHSLDTASLILGQTVAQINGQENVTKAYKEGDIDSARLDVSA